MGPVCQFTIQALEKSHLYLYMCFYLYFCLYLHLYFVYVFWAVAPSKDTALLQVLLH